MTLAYPVSLPITILLAVIAAGGALVWFRPDWKVTGPVGGLMLAGFYLALRYATWSAELTDEGITVKAPVNVNQPGAAMRWADVHSLRVYRRASVTGGGRSLRIGGRDKDPVFLPIADMNTAEAAQLAEEIIRRTGVDRRETFDRRRLEFDLRRATRGRPALLRLEPR